MATASPSATASTSRWRPIRPIVETVNCTVAWPPGWFVRSAGSRAIDDESPPIENASGLIAGGELQIRGKGFAQDDRPKVTIGEVGAPVIIGSDSFVIVRVPEGATVGYDAEADRDGEDDGAQPWYARERAGARGIVEARTDQRFGRILDQQHQLDVGLVRMADGQPAHPGAHVEVGADDQARCLFEDRADELLGEVLVRHLDDDLGVVDLLLLRFDGEPEPRAAATDEGGQGFQNFTGLAIFLSMLLAVFSDHLAHYFLGVPRGFVGRG